VVATTPFSFFASASSIVRAGARPVFVDIDPATLNLDPAQLERAVTTTFARQVKAFIPVHLFGQCCDMDSCQRIAAEHKLAMIEDAAQAFGATWRGRRAGSFAAAAAFSFYPTKNLSAYGDAGCIMTDDAAIAEHVRRLRNHGGHERYYHDEIGWNSRLDALQAAILRVKLNYVTEWNNRRRERAAYYDRLLAESGLGGTGTGISAAQPIARLGVGAQAHHIFHQYVVRAHRRDELREFLGARGVGTEIYYPVPLHLQKCFAYLGYGEGDLPEAERAAREVLALPMFPELTEDEQRYVTQAIAQFYS
jgi:dTDP-4-amino-4,6-dideoxygalactose transaminase